MKIYERYFQGQANDIYALIVGFDIWDEDLQYGPAQGQNKLLSPIYIYICTHQRCILGLSSGILKMHQVAHEAEDTGVLDCIWKVYQGHVKGILKIYEWQGHGQ